VLLLFPIRTQHWISSRYNSREGNRFIVFPIVLIIISSIIRNSEKGSGELERLIGHLSSYDLKVIISNNSGAVDYILAFVGIVMSRLSLSE
jgi:hypothetical protein